MRTLSRSSPWLIAVVVVAASARAASADVVPFDKLAVMSSPLPVRFPAPTETPATIAATEHVDGIFTALAPQAQRKVTEEQGYRYIGVFPSDAQARMYASDGTFGDVPGSREARPRACLALGDTLQPRMRMQLRTKPYEPPKPTPQQIALLKTMHRWPPPPPPKPATPVKPGPPKDTVQRVRLERLTLDADAAVIDTTDAFVDLQTLGTRLVSKSSVKLTRVGTGPNGLGVFAARDEKGQTEVLVTSPELPAPETHADRPAQQEALMSTAGTLVTQTPSGSLASSGCGRVRFALSTAPGTGQMATVIATAFLPPSTDPDEAPPDDDSDGDGIPDEAGFVVQQAVRRGMRKQRARPVAVNVSLSQLASETSPLLSVTLGWAGKEQKLSF